jgi:hypothetical protein
MVRLMTRAPGDPIFEPRPFKHATRWYIISRWPDGHFEQVIDARNGNDFKSKAEALSWIEAHSRAWIDGHRLAYPDPGLPAPGRKRIVTR